MRGPEDGDRTGLSLEACWARSAILWPHAAGRHPLVWRHATEKTEKNQPAFCGSLPSSLRTSAASSSPCRCRPLVSFSRDSACQALFQSSTSSSRPARQQPLSETVGHPSAPKITLSSQNPAVKAIEPTRAQVFPDGPTLATPPMSLCCTG